MVGKVADASTLGAVVFGEPRSDEALTLLDSADLYEPALLRYELASIARKKIVRYPEQQHLLLRALEMALALDMTWVEVDYPQVVALALETGLTTYDASYLYVARALGLDLVTFDERLQSARGDLPG